MMIDNSCYIMYSPDLSWGIPCYAGDYIIYGWEGQSSSTLIPARCISAISAHLLAVRRGERGVEWIGGPLWSPAVPGMQAA